jgi:cytochrome P450
VTEDDEFHGYTIPKGSTVLACTYSIHLRSEDYDNPEEFRPERYVNNPYGTKSKRSTTQEQAEEGRRPTYAFGVGRRGCPGEEFAMNALQIAAAKLLWAFDISCEGTPDMSWETGYAAGLVTAPKGFNPRFAVRSAQKKEAVERDYHRSEEYLKETLG